MTSAFGGQRSIQLSYGCHCWWGVVHATRQDAGDSASRRASQLASRTGSPNAGPCGLTLGAALTECGERADSAVREVVRDHREVCRQTGR